MTTGSSLGSKTHPRCRNAGGGCSTGCRLRRALATGDWPATGVLDGPGIRRDRDADLARARTGASGRALTRLSETAAAGAAEFLYGSACPASRCTPSTWTVRSCRRSPRQRTVAAPVPEISDRNAIWSAVGPVSRPGPVSSRRQSARARRARRSRASGRPDAGERQLCARSRTSGRRPPGCSARARPARRSPARCP